MLKTKVSKVLRSLGLLHLADSVRFYIHQSRNKQSNLEFKAIHPGVDLPPDYLMYESFGLDYKRYYEGGLETAEWLLKLLSPHLELTAVKVLDWGCGPGRVIRHLPGLLDKHSVCYGTDYNAQSIAWCKANLPGIAFNHNGLKAELPYADDTFDVVYGFSIFTHLSEPKHRSWFNEHFRITKPGGIMLFSTQGDNYREMLTADELQAYDAGKLVVRGKVKEGHRVFSAYQPKEYLESLFRPVEILEHLERKPQPNRPIPQDVWILKKPME